MFFQRRPDVVQAIQWTGDNAEAILEFIESQTHTTLESLQDFLSVNDKGLWFVKSNNGNISGVYTNQHFVKEFLQKHETL